MECGHVAPSCARRCAGSRLLGHARCSFFVRSRHHARVRPRRAIRWFAGSMWRAHQHSHSYLLHRTTLRMGGRGAGQERGRHRQHIPRATCEVRAHLARTRLRLEPAAQQAHSAHFASIVASMLPLPHALPAMPHPTSLLPAVPGPRALCCALCRTPQNPSARLARPAAFACVAYVCVWVGVWGDVMFQCRSMRRLFSGQLPSAVRLFQFLLVWPLLCVRYRFRFGCSCGSLLAHHLLTPRTAHTHLTHHTNCTLTTHSPHTSYTPHTHPHHTTSTHHTQSSPPFPPLHSFLLTQVGDGIQSWLCLVDALCA